MWQSVCHYFELFVYSKTINQVIESIDDPHTLRTLVPVCRLGLSSDRVWTSSIYSIYYTYITSNSNQPTFCFGLDLYNLLGWACLILGLFDIVLDIVLSVVFFLSALKCICLLRRQVPTSRKWRHHRIDRSSRSRVWLICGMWLDGC
jgi:hypothetical protein